MSKFWFTFPEISNETARFVLNIMVKKRLLNKRGEYPKFIPNLSQIIINIPIFYENRN